MADRVGASLYWALMCATAVGVVPAAVPSAYAQGTEAGSAAEQGFAIAPQPLSSALTEFGRQSGMQISAPSALISGFEAPGVSGSMSADQALRQLLGGTGLVYRREAGGIVIFSPGAPDDPTAIVLDPINVDAPDPGDARAGAADRGSSIAVSRGDLERLAPQNIKDVFAGESAVTVGGAMPLAQKFYVHGVEETNLAVSIDGARQNNKIFHHSGNNLIDPLILKQVRVDPNVAPADAGPGALAGSIVYETVDVDDVLAPDRNVGAYGTTLFETNSNTFTNSATAFGRDEGFEALGFARYSTGGNYEDGDGNNVAGTAADLSSFVGKGGYETLDGDRVELNGQYIKDKDDRPFRANIGDIDGVLNPLVREYSLERHTFSVNYNNTQAFGLIDPEVTVGYSQSKLEVPDPFGSKGETGSFSGKAENDFNLSAVDVITAGVDFYSDQAKYNDPDYDVDEKAHNVGLYSQVRLVPLEDLRLSFGGRADQQWFDGIDGSDQSNAGLSGNVSAVYDLFDHVTLNAGYSNVFGGIALGENFILNPDWEYDDIDPVRSENYIAGAEFDWEGFLLSGEVFRSDFDNARDETFGGGPDNTVDFKAYGYSLGAGYTWGPGFVRASYTDSKIKINGDSADSDASQYLGAPIGKVIAVETAHYFESLNLTVGGTVAAALENDETEGAGTDSLGSYYVVNAFIEYTPDFAEYASFRFGVNNLFDENYAERGTYGAEFPTVQPLNEPGRSFLFSASLRF